MSRLMNLFRKRKLEAQMEEEFRFHIDQLTEKYMRAGLSRDDAHMAARREFGSAESAKQRYRDQRGVPLLEDFWTDLRYAARLLIRNPLFTAVCVLTLALGIGANAAIFSLINAALLKLAPYPDAARLVEVCRQQPGQPVGSPFHNSQKYFYLKERTRVFENLAARKAAGDANLVVNGEAQQASGFRVSANFFDALGVKPLLGRVFNAEEDRPGGPNVAILSHGLWQRRFGGDPDILGKSINLGGRFYTVTGVMREDLTAIPRADLWVPLQARPVNDGKNTYVFGRLRPGVSTEQARQEVDAIVRAYRKEHAPTSEMSPEEGASLAPFNSLEGRMAKTPLMILFAAVGVVLLIACANLANLLLARATARQREVSIRTTLGAGRTRIVRQLLAESLLIAALGGLLGVAVAYGLVPALIALNPLSLSSFRDVRIDPMVLAFTGVLSLVTGLLFGLAPALQATRINPGKKSGRVRQLIVVSEVALSTILLIGAGLLVRTFWNLLSVHPGVDVTNVLAGRMPMQGDKYNTAEKADLFFRRGLERIRSLPNVESAAVILNLPMETGMNVVTRIPSSKDPEQVKLTDWRYSTPEFFQVVRIPLLAGRVFTDADGANAASVAVVNQRFARLYFREQNPVGQMLRMQSNSYVTIIGVVGDAKSANFRAEAPPIVYVPVAQAFDDHVRAAHGWFQPWWVVRSRDGAGLVESIQKQVASIDPLQPFSGFRTLEEVRARALKTDRSMMFLLSGFAFVALFLAAAGIYGVISYMVAQRTHEIGIRMALGATVQNVIAAIVKRGVGLALAGIVVGVAGAVALTRFLDALVFGIKPADPATFVSGAGFLLFLAVLASAIPAMRITRLDPAKALRVE